jgi:glucose/arabinose dehydrogenase
MPLSKAQIMKRRQFLRLGAGTAMASLAGCSLKQNDESERATGPAVSLDPVVTGVTFPTNMVFLPTGDRLLTERTGQVLRHTDDGLVGEPLLNLMDQMSKVEKEKGLIGMALHPDFERNRKLYLRYSGALPDSMSADLSHIAVLSEFQMSEDMTTIDPDSQRRILEIPEPGPVHNAGAIAFGPDGYLYVAMGDGRRTDLNAGDSWSWWYEQGQTAQNLTDNLLGGILRIDVDNPSAGREYGIPDDNPLVGKEGRDEYYSWGLRNPYKMSFDGDTLFVGNVGETLRESIYITEKGANHGWPVIEGSSCTPTTAVGHTVADNPLNVFNPKTWQSLTNRVSPVGVCPEDADQEFDTPIAEYRRPGSRSVTGGYVYRGDSIPELQGKYICGDFIPPCPIFAIDFQREEGTPRDLAELTITNTESGRLSRSILSFARDSAGEVYVLTTGYAEGSGQASRLTPAE